MTADEPRTLASAAIEHLTNLGLAVVGLLITHETAYSLAAGLRPLLAGHGDRLIDHGHQSLLVATAGPLALWVTTWFVLRQVRRLNVVATWGPTPLSAAIVALYLTQESIEIAAAGPTGPGLGGLVENRAIVLGVLVVPIVARILLRLLDRAEELVQAWLAGTRPPSPDSPVPVIRPSAATVLTSVAHKTGNPRGPPLRDVTTDQVRIS